MFGINIMMNRFKVDTMKMLLKYNKKVKDVRYVTTQKTSCSMQEFIHMIDNHDVVSDNRFISTDLKIVGDNWWLERLNDAWSYRCVPPRVIDFSIQLDWINDFVIIENYSI
jgi:hypothetical protein